MLRHAGQPVCTALFKPPFACARTRAAAAHKGDGGAACFGPHQRQLVPQEVLNGGEEGGRLLHPASAMWGSGVSKVPPRQGNAVGGTPSFTLQCWGANTQAQPLSSPRPAIQTSPPSPPPLRRGCTPPAGRAPWHAARRRGAAAARSCRAAGGRIRLPGAPLRRRAAGGSRPLPTAPAGRRGQRRRHAGWPPHASPWPPGQERVRGGAAEGSAGDVGACVPQAQKAWEHEGQPVQQNSWWFQLRTCTASAWKPARRQQ